jgi:hypothetical protein
MKLNPSLYPNEVGFHPRSDFIHVSGFIPPMADLVAVLRTAKSQFYNLIFHITTIS